MSPWTRDFLTNEIQRIWGFHLLPLYLLGKWQRSKDWIPYRRWPRRIGLDQYRSPKCENRKEVEPIAKIVEEKGAVEGNIVTISDKEGVWYMEIYRPSICSDSLPEDRFVVFPKYLLLGHVDLSDTEHDRFTRSWKSRQRSQSYKGSGRKIPRSPSSNPPLHEADRSGLVGGIKSLEPKSLLLNMTMRLWTFFIQPIENQPPRCHESPTQSFGRNQI